MELLYDIGIFLSFSGYHGGKRWAGEAVWAEHLHKTLPCRDNQEASVHGHVNSTIEIQNEYKSQEGSREVRGSVLSWDLEGNSELVWSVSLQMGGIPWQYKTEDPRIFQVIERLKCYFI